MKYLIRIGVEGLRRVLERKGFTTSEKVEKEIQDYEIENNPILLWLQETEERKIINQPTKDVHKAYRVFCIENGFQDMTLTSFTKELSKRLKISVKRTRINGELIGIYIKEG